MAAPGCSEEVARQRRIRGGGGGGAGGGATGADWGRHRRVRAAALVRERGEREAACIFGCCSLLNCAMGNWVIRLDCGAMLPVQMEERFRLLMATDFVPVFTLMGHTLQHS